MKHLYLLLFASFVAGCQADACSAKDANLRNIFPERLFCQDQRYNMGHSHLTQTVLLDNARYVVKKSQANDSVAYVSSLQRSGSIFDQQWSRIYYNEDDSIRWFAPLDAVETAFDRFEVNGTLVTHDCARHGLLGPSYAYWNGREAACACQIDSVSVDGTCVPGCQPMHGHAMCGPRCNLRATSSQFNAYTLYTHKETCQPVCVNNAPSVYGACRAHKPMARASKEACFVKLFVH